MTVAKHELFMAQGGHQYSAGSTDHLGVIPELPANCQHKLCSDLCSFADVGVKPHRGAISSCPHVTLDRDRAKTSPQVCNGLKHASSSEPASC